MINDIHIFNLENALEELEANSNTDFQIERNKSLRELLHILKIEREEARPKK